MSILWVIAGVAYCIYRLSKESHGGSELAGIGAVFFVAFSIFILYVAIMAGLWWIIVPLLIIAIPVLCRIENSSALSSFDMQAHEEWLEAVEPILAQDTSEMSYKEQYHHSVRVAEINKQKESYPTLLEYAKTTKRWCEIWIPIGFGALPFSYIIYNAAYIENPVMLILCCIPLVISALYVDITIRKPN